jgi:DNA-binding transcriptional regulator YdaS (Cro superfamily)
MYLTRRESFGVAHLRTRKPFVKSKTAGEAARDFVKEAFEIVGGNSAVARSLGVHPSATEKWYQLSLRTGMPRIPEDRCKQLESLVDSRITRVQMRPDLFVDAKKVA